MNTKLGRAVCAGGLCLALISCAEPEFVTLQPIGAPTPERATQTFVDADGCSWWIIGNADNLSWAPMTNNTGEHVCDSGATRFDPPGDAQATAPVPGQTPQEASAAQLSSQLSDAIDDTTVATATNGLSASAAAPILADGKQYFVQVATFAREKNIIASEAMFRNLGYNISSGSQARENDRLYRLVLGPFASQPEASEAVERAFAEGFDDAFPFRR